MRVTPTTNPPPEERRIHLGRLWPTLNDVPVLRSRRDGDDIMSLSDYRRSCRLLGFKASGDVVQRLRTCWAYGYYDLADGRQLQFNREYQVIGERRDASSFWQSSQYQWESDVKDTSVVTVTWLYDDGCPPWRNDDCFKRYQLVLWLRLEQPRSPRRRPRNGRGLNGKGAAPEAAE